VKRLGTMDGVVRVSVAIAGGARADAARLRWADALGLEAPAFAQVGPICAGEER
jgi:hypothetical protein